MNDKPTPTATVYVEGRFGDRMSTVAVGPVASTQGVHLTEANRVDFSRVQSTMTDIVNAWRASRGNPPLDLNDVHYGSLSWASPEAFLRSNAFGVDFVQPELIGTGRADETNIVRVLAGTHPDWPRMPLGGNPYASDAQIQVIRDWINGLPPQPARPTRAGAAPERPSSDARVLLGAVRPQANPLALPTGYRSAFG